MEQKGSFIGFTFGNKHSSELGIFRTSNSNRYNINLIPTLSDQVIDIEGADGKYYYDSKYVKREIQISYAFYGMTDDQLKAIKKLLNEKKTNSLILDEDPYKVWTAKLTGSSVIKHICFSGKTERFYCGEGIFIFTAFYPYARSRYQYIEDYTVESIPEWSSGEFLFGDDYEEKIYPAILSYDFEEEGNYASIIGLEENFKGWIDDTRLLIDSDLSFDNINSYVEFFKGEGLYNNLNEWREASKIPSRDKYGLYNNGEYILYNAGDIPMHFKIYFPISDNPQSFTLSFGDKKLVLSNVISKRNDSYILIDGFNRTIVGCDNSYKHTKNFYNEKIIEGDFFDLPQGEVKLKSNLEGKLEFYYLYL